MADDTSFNVDALVEEGLQLYSKGELDAALARWREAVARQPENHRAREYIRYVEDNRAALEEGFRSARQQASSGVAEGRTDAQEASGAERPPRLVAAVGRLERRQAGGSAGRRASPGEQPEPAGPPSLEAVPEPSREVLDPEQLAALVRRGRAPQTLEVETESGPGELVLEVDGEVAEPPELPPETDEPDSSFVELVEEITRTAQDIAREMASPAELAVPPLPVQGPVDLDGLRAKVADTKRRLEQEARAAPAGGPPEMSPAEAPTSEVLAARGLRLADESSVSSRPTPSTGSPQVPGAVPRGRSRLATPLTLIGGGAGKAGSHDFEPLEVTPVAQRIPTPARLVSVRETREDPGAELVERLDGGDALEALAELARDPRTPVSLSRTPPQVSPGAPGAQTSPAAEPKASTWIGIGPGPTDEAEGLAAGSNLPTPDRTQPAIAVEASAERVESLLESARQLHEQGTFEGSLWLCERVLAVDGTCRGAQELLRRNQEILLAQYRRQMGDARDVPVVQIPQHEIMWHKLDHRAGFLLSRIDGQLSFEDLLDVSGMSEFEACRILSQLMSQGVIGPRR